MMKRAELNSSKNILKFKLQEKRLNGEDTDVKIICKDNSIFKAHRLVLVSISSYFEKMFSGSFKESETKEVRLNFDSQTMAKVLDFLYLQDDANIQLKDLDQAENLLEAADMFQMTSLFSMCCTKVQEIMTEKHFTRIDSWNQLYGTDQTQNLFDQYVKKFWQKILNTDLYVKCDVKQFKLIIEKWTESNNYNGRMAYTTYPSYNQCGSVSGPNMVITKIIIWVKANSKERSSHVASLFSKLHNPRLSSSFVRSLLSDKFVKTNCDVLVQLLDCVLDVESQNYR